MATFDDLYMGGDPSQLLNHPVGVFSSQVQGGPVTSFDGREWDWNIYLHLGLNVNLGKYSIHI